MAMKDKIVADDKPEHRRRSVRLKGFDYARAAGKGKGFGGGDHDS